MALSGRFILRDSLSTEARSSIIGLMLVKVLFGGFTRRCLRQGPSWHVLLQRRVGRVLWGVTAGTDTSGSRSVVLQSATTASVTKCVKGCLL